MNENSDLLIVGNLKLKMQNDHLYAQKYIIFNLHEIN